MWTAEQEEDVKILSSLPLVAFRPQSTPTSRYGLKRESQLTVLLHDRQNLDNHFRAGSDQDLPLPATFGIDNVVLKQTSACIPAPGKQSKRLLIGWRDGPNNHSGRKRGPC